MLYEYVLSELFPNKENETDSLPDDFNDVLQIRAAPIHSNKSSAKSTKVNWFEEINSANRFLKSNGKPVENYSTPIRRGSVHITTQVIQKYVRSIYCTMKCLLICNCIYNIFFFIIEN